MYTVNEKIYRFSSAAHEVIFIYSKLVNLSRCCTRKYNVSFLSAPCTVWVVNVLLLFYAGARVIISNCFNPFTYLQLDTHLHPSTMCICC